MTRKGTARQGASAAGLVGAAYVTLALRWSAAAVTASGPDREPTPPPVQPTIIRDEVSPWTYVSVAVLAAALTLAVVVVAERVRRRRSGSLRPQGDTRVRQLHRRKQ